VRRPRGADLGRLLVGFFALPVAYEIFRAGYFGTLVPNTALAKDSAGMYWSQGWEYLVDLIAPYLLVVPLLALVAVVAVAVRTRARLTDLVVVFALPVAGLAHALFIVESGGDYLHARLLLPSLFAVVAPFAVVPWERRFVVPVAVVGVWAVVAIAFLRPTMVEGLVPATKYETVDARALMESFTRPGHRPVLATDFMFDDGPRAKRLQEQGKRALVTTTRGALLDVTPDRTTLLSLASGVSGYRAGPDVLVQEVNSLGDPVGSRMPPTAISRPGHRKHEPWAWVVALVTRPDADEALDVDRLESSIYGAPDIDPADVAAARHALRCGALASLRDATRDNLDAGRFWSNLTGSIGRTRLVVPRDPKDAERKFCGAP
jgi:arabinofuranosyltransferase